MGIVDPLIGILRPVQFRGKTRLLSPLIPHTGTRTARVNGFEVELDLSEHIQRLVFLGSYERWESKVVARLLRPGMCFVDVGANIGYFSLLAARLVGPLGQVVSVEPSRYAADRFARTVAANGITNVRLERIGLGRENGECILYNPLPDNHSPSMLGDPTRAGVSVPVRRLDDCLAEWGIDRVDLLKMDVEGFEPAVIDGAAAALAAGRVRAILCEFNEYWLRKAGSSPEGLRDRILGFGYRDLTDSPWDAAAPVVNRLFVADAVPTDR